MKTTSKSLKEFLSTKYDIIIHKYDSLEILKKEFVAIFPANQLHNMLIDDYVVGSDKFV